MPFLTGYKRTCRTIEPTWPWPEHASASTSYLSVHLISHRCTLVAMSSRPLWTRLTCPLRRSQRQFQASSCTRLACISRRRQSSAVLRQDSSRSWTTGRVLLFSAFASSLTYLYGVIDTGSQVDQLRKTDEASNYSYGSSEDLAKAGLLSRIGCFRLLMTSET